MPTVIGRFVENQTIRVSVGQPSSVVRPSASHTWRLAETSTHTTSAHPCLITRLVSGTHLLLQYKLIYCISHTVLVYAIHTWLVLVCVWDLLTNHSSEGCSRVDFYMTATVTTWKPGCFLMPVCVICRRSAPLARTAKVTIWMCGQCSATASTGGVMRPCGSNMWEPMSSWAWQASSTATPFAASARCTAWALPASTTGGAPWRVFLSSPARSHCATTSSNIITRRRRWTCVHCGCLLLWWFCSSPGPNYEWCKIFDWWLATVHEKHHAPRCFERRKIMLCFLSVLYLV